MAEKKDPAVDETAKKPDKKKELIAMACDAYGIDEKYVFASGVRQDPRRKTTVAVIVTRGGKKVFYAAGDEVTPLNQIQITGINPNPKSKKLTPGPKK